MNFSSKLIEEAVDAIAGLPGIGRKTALRLALHLIKQDVDVAEDLANALMKMRLNIKDCARCHNISDEDLCAICANKSRDEKMICVVEGIRDVMAIEDTGQYRGMYHVLGGVIAPIEGIGPDDLNIQSLVNRIPNEGIKEVVMAISPTIEGETTVFYISKQLKDLPIRISTIARGVSFGGELEYADELTLGRSIVARIPYNTNQ